MDLPNEITNLIPPLLDAENLCSERAPLERLADAVTRAPDYHREPTSTHEAFQPSTSITPKLSHKLVAYLFDRRFGWSEGKLRWGWLRSTFASQKRGKMNNELPVGSHVAFEEDKKKINKSASVILRQLRRIMRSETWLDAILYSVHQAANKPVVRQQAFAHVYDWLRDLLKFHTVAMPLAFHEFLRVKRLILLGLTDVWSATRKKCSLRLYGVLDVLSISQVRTIFEAFSSVATSAEIIEGTTQLTKSESEVQKGIQSKKNESANHVLSTGESGKISDIDGTKTVLEKRRWGWKAKEGALLGITVIIKRFRRLQMQKSHLYITSGGSGNPFIVTSPPTSPKSSENYTAFSTSNPALLKIPNPNSASSFNNKNHRISHGNKLLPNFVHNNIRAIVYPLLRHAQLGVRENATRAFAAFLSRNDTDELLRAFCDIIEQLRQPFKSAVPQHKPLVRINTFDTAGHVPNPKKALLEPDEEAKALGLLTAYEAEGILGLVVLLVKMVPAEWFVRTVTDTSGKTEIDMEVVLVTLQRYLGHPASTVRQSCSEVFLHLVAKATATPSHLQSFSRKPLLLIPKILRMLAGIGESKEKNDNLENLPTSSKVKLQSAPQWLNRWEWKEGRLLAYELILQYLLENHRICVLAFYNRKDDVERSELNAKKVNEYSSNAVNGQPLLSPSSATSPASEARSDLNTNVSPLNAAVREETWPEPSPPPSRSPGRLRLRDKHPSDSKTLNIEDKGSSNPPVSLLNALLTTSNHELMDDGRGERSEFIALLTEMLLHTREALASKRFEMQRIVRQVLPALTRVICWYDVGVCTKIWKRAEAFARDGDLPSCCVVAKTMLASLEQVRDIQENVSWRSNDAVRCVLVKLCANLPVIITATKTLAQSECREGWIIDTTIRLITLLFIIFAKNETVMIDPQTVRNLSNEMLGSITKYLSVEERKVLGKLLLVRLSQLHSGSLSMSPSVNSALHAATDVMNDCFTTSRPSKTETYQRATLTIDRAIARDLSSILPDLVARLEPAECMGIVTTLLRWLRMPHATLEARLSLLKALERVFILPLKIYGQQTVDNKCTTTCMPRVMNRTGLRIDTSAPSKSGIHARKSSVIAEEERFHTEMIRVIESGLLLSICKHCTTVLSCLLLQDCSSEASIFRQLLSLIETTCLLVPDLRFAPVPLRALVDRLRQSGHISDKAVENPVDIATRLQSNDINHKHKKRVYNGDRSNCDAIQSGSEISLSDENDEGNISESGNDNDWDDWDEEDGGEDAAVDVLFTYAVQFVGALAAAFPGKAIMEDKQNYLNRVKMRRGDLQEIIKEMPDEYRITLMQLLKDS